MDQERLTFFRAKLEEMAQALMSEAEKTINEMTDHSDNYPDPTDRASAESDRNFELRIRDRERKLLSKVREAMERIDNGTYGICESCGDDISHQRLEARPVTTLCFDCKSEQEQFEKAQGK